MSLLSKVTRCMRTIAPLELAETSWDNVGVLVGKGGEAQFNLSLTCLGLTRA
jgi:putative NIF3 family GTP cyclohydrolase 1 type 2